MLVMLLMMMTIICLNNNTMPRQQQEFSSIHWHVSFIPRHQPSGTTRPLSLLTLRLIFYTSTCYTHTHVVLRILYLPMLPSETITVCYSISLPAVRLVGVLATKLGLACLGVGVRGSIEGGRGSGRSRWAVVACSDEYKLHLCLQDKVIMHLSDIPATNVYATRLNLYVLLGIR